MDAFVSLRRFGACLLGLALLCLPQPAQGWNADMDGLLLCNTNKNHDIVVAVASKAVPWGIAAVMAAGWDRAGWWTIGAGQCESTIPLKDVHNIEVWLHVRVVGGTAIEWDTSKERFCVHPENKFNGFAWSKAEIQRCAAGERLETFSHMGSLYNVEDEYSIYQVENRKINLEFTYTKTSGNRKPAPSTSKEAVPSRHPDTGRLVEAKSGPANMSLSLKLYASAYPASEAALIRQYADSIGDQKDYEMLTCTYNVDIVNGRFRRNQHVFWRDTVHPGYIDLIRRLGNKQIARTYGVLPTSSCPKSLEAAIKLKDQNFREALSLR